MYPEKFTFENLKNRTARVVGIASSIYQLYSDIKKGKKKGKY